MSRHVRDGIGACNGFAQTGQAFVLSGLKGLALQAFQLNADGVVVAIGAPPVFGLACVPGPVIAADKLPQCTIAPYIEVGRHLQPPDLPKVGVSVPVQLVGEQGLHFVTAVLARRQADGMHHQQVDARTDRSGPEVGRIQPLGVAVPAVLPKGGV